MLLRGENGILTQAASSKKIQEDKSAEEEFKLAWTARMSKFYEDLAAGKIKETDFKDYFKGDALTAELGNNGRVFGVTYDSTNETFNLQYRSSRWKLLYCRCF